MKKTYKYNKSSSSIFFSPILSLISQGESIKNGMKSTRLSIRSRRNAFTIIEVIIAMTLLAVIFGTFLLAIVGVQSINRRSASITEFMYQTSQKNVDSKMDKITTYMEMNGELESMKKRLQKLESYHDRSFVSVINSLRAQIVQKEADVQQMLRDTDVLSNVSERKIKFSTGNSAHINRVVSAYEFSSDLTNYKKANMRLRDAKGNLLNEEANTDNEFYSFGKIGGATAIYYLYSSEYVPVTIPDPTVFKRNKPDYAYIGDTIRTEYSTPNYDINYQYFNYWHMSDPRLATDSAALNSEVERLSRGIYSELRKYNEMTGYVNNYNAEYITVSANYCPQHRYEKLISERENTLLVNDLKKYGGKFFAMGIQPARGTVGAAFPIQFSPYETYVFPLKKSDGLKVHFNPSLIAMEYKAGASIPTEVTHNIMVINNFSASDMPLTTNQSSKSNTVLGSIPNIMQKATFNDAFANNNQADGKYEAQFIPVLANSNTENLYTMMMSLYPRDPYNNYEELNAQGNSNRQHPNYLPLFKVKSDFDGHDEDAMNYHAAHIFRIETPINDSIKELYNPILQTKYDSKTVEIPNSANNKILALNNIGMNIKKLDKGDSGVIFLKFFARDVSAAPLDASSINDSEKKKILDEIDNSGITEKVFKNIDKSFSDDQPKEVEDDKRYFADLFRIGLEDKKNIDEDRMTPLVSFSYSYLASKYRDETGAERYGLTMPLLLRFSDELRNRTNAHIVYSRQDSPHVFSRNGDFRDKVFRLDYDFMRSKKPQSVIEHNKLNTACLFYRIDGSWHDAQTLDYVITINSAVVSKGRIFMNHHSRRANENNLILSVGGIGNLNIAEVLDYKIRLQSDFFNPSMTRLNVVQQIINAADLDLTLARAYANLPVADGLLIDALSENKVVLIPALATGNN